MKVNSPEIEAIIAADERVIQLKKTLINRNNILYQCRQRQKASVKELRDIREKQSIFLLESGNKYYWSFLGYPYMMRWMRENKLKSADMTMIGEIYFHGLTTMVHLGGWKRTFAKKRMDSLEKRGFVQMIKIKSHWANQKHAYILTEIGKKLYEDYKAGFDYYLENMKEFML